MSLSVSTAFLEAESSDANLPRAKVELVLGNYFNSAAYDTSVTASGADASGVYPASGAINGDRTELNIGSASSADNDTGLSSWRSAVAPSTTAQTLTFSLTSARTINCAKLYHLSTNPIKSWKLEAYVSGAYSQVAATSDLGGTGTLFSTTAELDTVDFSSTSSNSWKLTISQMQATNAVADVVEIEAYRKIDITDRVNGISINRQRDYKMRNPMAATLSINAINTDRYFSPSHIPVPTVIQTDILTTGSSWSAITDGSPITVRCLGAGSGGAAGDQTPSDHQKGGAGGAYAESVVNYVSGASVVIAIGTGGAGGVGAGSASAGGDTSFNSGQVLAGGATNQSQPGSSAASTGDIKYSGGTGGGSTSGYGGCGGGGAGGPNGDGKTGGNCGSGYGGGGGGGVSGGSVGTNSPAGDSGGDGGDNYGGTGHGVGDTTGGGATAGTDGGGGGGGHGGHTGGATTSVGGAGGDGTNWNGIAGPGGGGGGGGGTDNSDIGRAGANGGYGAGGGAGGFKSGASGDGGNGGNGLIAITYVANPGEPGFVNDELAPNIGIVVTQGFDVYRDTPELVPGFTGYVDRISVNPLTRTCKIEARDATKILVNRTDTTKLKNNIDISDAIKYVLNRANISSYEMDFAPTSINIDYFFTNNEQALTTIQNLTEAAIDAIFYFDESGIARFQYYASNVAQSRVISTESQWGSGSSTNFIASDAPGELVLDYHCDSATTYATPNWHQTTTGWTFTTGAKGFWTLSGFLLWYNSAASSNDGWAYHSADWVMGRWQLPFYSPRVAEGYTTYFFMSANAPTGGNDFKGGYGIKMAWGNPTTLSLVRSDTTTVDGATALTSASLSFSTQTSYYVRVSRAPISGLFKVQCAIGAGSYSSQITAVDTTYAACAYLGIHCYSPAARTPSWNSGPWGNLFNPPSGFSGTWVSPPLDLSAYLLSLGSVSSTHTDNGATVKFYTRSSADGSSYGSWVEVGSTGTIGSTMARYMQLEIVGSVTTTANDYPDIFDISVTWVTGGGSSKYPTTSSFVFSFDSNLIDAQQETSDNLSGDTSVLNDVAVQAMPLVLQGTDSDTAWQGTTGTPPEKVSAADPLTLASATWTYFYPIISGGMDVSRMSGTNPAAVVLAGTGGGGITWGIVSPHPTRPVVGLYAPTGYSVTDFRLVGKTFANADYLQEQKVKDAVSIARYGSRQYSLSNPWIISTAIADQIADSLIENYADPTAYIPQITIRPTFSAQLGDRVTVSDNNLDLSDDYIVAGLRYNFGCSMTDAQVSTQMVLMKVPQGL